MKIINYETRYTEKEAKAKIIALVNDFGANTSRDNSGLSYRSEGVPGTGGGTIAISYGLPIYRQGIAYYKQLRFAG